MMMKNIPVLFMFLGMLMLISSTSAHALGIAPARIVINFKPDMKTSINYYVRGEDRAMRVNITSECELSQYIKPLMSSTLTLNPGEIRFFDVLIELPGYIDKPGLYDCSVVASEVPLEPGVSTVSAYGAVAGIISIYVPFPEKYVEASLFAPTVSVNQPVRFVITLVNRGLQNTTASGTISVYDDANNLLATLASKEKFAEVGGQNMNMDDVVWDTAGRSPGNYFATASVDYGGDRPAASSARFKIGDVLIKITNVTYGELKKDSINKFTVLLDSFWSEKIAGAYVTLDVMKGNDLAGSAKSESFDMQPWGSSSVAMYWDANGQTEGSYSARFIVHFGDKTNEKTIPIEIRAHEDYTLYLIMILIAAAIAAIALYLRRRKRSRKA